MVGTFGMLSRKPAHQGTLPNGGKPDEAHTGHARSCYIEASCTPLAPATIRVSTRSVPPPPPPLEVGVKSSRLSFASLALS